jgi:dUTPase
MLIKFKRLRENARLPRQTEGNAGLDLYFAPENNEPITILANNRVKLQTGIAWEPEPGYYSVIKDSFPSSNKSSRSTVPDSDDKSNLYFLQ